jgi:hypothetical protein
MTDFSFWNFASGLAIFAVLLVFQFLPQSTQRISQRTQSKLTHCATGLLATPVAVEGNSVCADW